MGGGARSVLTASHCWAVMENTAQSTSLPTAKPRLVCEKCGRTFVLEEALLYHGIMCTKIMETKVKEEQVDVKNFFGSDSEDDDDCELLFYTAKNLELNSQQEILAGLEKRLGVKVTEFKGKYELGGRVDRKMKTKYQRMELTERNRNPGGQSQGQKTGRVRCDCCHRDGPPPSSPE